MPRSLKISSTTSAAAGVVLAHGVRVGGRAFKKGRVLSAADLELLEREGHETIIGARLEASDGGSMFS